MKILYHFTVAILIIGMSSCASKPRKPKEDFIQNCYSLKKGMRVDEVMLIMGEPTASNTQSFPGVPEQGQVFHFNDISRSLMTVFLGNKMMCANLSVQENGFTDSIEIVKYDPNDFMPVQYRQNNTRGSIKPNTEGNIPFDEAKRKLIQRYINKEITKDDYFQMLKELKASYGQ